GDLSRRGCELLLIEVYQGCLMEILTAAALLLYLTDSCRIPQGWAHFPSNWRKVPGMGQVICRHNMMRIKFKFSETVCCATSQIHGKPGPKVARALEFDEAPKYLDEVSTLAYCSWLCKSVQ
ncbi:MAG: hypothetical protein WA821_11075, partial [Anaerolineales bacterium]